MQTTSMAIDKPLDKEGVVRVHWDPSQLWEWNNGIHSNMDGPLEIIILSEVSQREKDKYLIMSLTST